MKKIKILYLTFHPEIGGGETILLSFISKLDTEIFKPIVIVTSKGRLWQKLKEMNIETYMLPLSGYFIRTLFIPGASILGIFRFLSFVKKIKPNLIHLNHLNFGVYAGVAGKLLKIPVVATAHGPWDCFYFYQDLVNSFFVDKILANTPKVAKSLTRRKILSPKKVEVVNFGVDIKKFKPNNKNYAKKILNLPQDNLIITIVGRLDPEKDPLNFLQAAKIISTQIPNISFLVVGSELGDFSAKNSQLGRQNRQFLSKNPKLAKKVIFTGFINNMPQIYAATDILVSSSLRESFGLALAEAAACGVPAVSTNIGGQSLIIENGKTGFLVPPKRPDLLAKKTLQLLKNPKLRQKCGKAARVRVVKNFSLGNYVRKIENIYLSLLESK